MVSTVVALSVSVVGLSVVGATVEALSVVGVVGVVVVPGADVAVVWGADVSADFESLEHPAATRASTTDATVTKRCDPIRRSLPRSARTEGLLGPEDLVHRRRAREPRR